MYQSTEGDNEKGCFSTRVFSTLEPDWFLGLSGVLHSASVRRSHPTSWVPKRSGGRHLSLNAPLSICLRFRGAAFRVYVWILLLVFFLHLQADSLQTHQKGLIVKVSSLLAKGILEAERRFELELRPSEVLVCCGLVAEHGKGLPSSARTKHRYTFFQRGEWFLT